MYTVPEIAGAERLLRGVVRLCGAATEEPTGVSRSALLGNGAEDDRAGS